MLSDWELSLFSKLTILRLLSSYETKVSLSYLDIGYFKTSGPYEDYLIVSKLSLMLSWDSSFLFDLSP